MAMFEKLQKEVERSQYELFRIIKAHGPKNQPPSSPGVYLEPPYYVFLKDKILGSVLYISSEVPVVMQSPAAR